MKTRTLLVLVAIFLALGFYANRSLNKANFYAENPTNPQVFEFDPGQAAAVQISNSEVTVAYSPHPEAGGLLPAGSWTLNEPTRALLFIDGARLAKSMSTAIREQVLEKGLSSEKLKEYGIGGENSVRLELKLRDGSMKRIEFGDAHPTNPQLVYAWLPDSGELLVTGGALKQQGSTAADLLQSHQGLVFNADELTQVRVKSVKGELSAERSGDGWKSADGAAVRTEKVLGWIVATQNFPIIDLAIDRGNPPPAPEKLAESEITFEASGKKLADLVFYATENPDRMFVKDRLNGKEFYIGRRPYDHFKFAEPLG